MPALHQTIRRQWTVREDARSKEVGWTIGSKTYRSRLESGRLGREFHTDFCMPYEQGEPLRNWRVGLPQFHNGLPQDGKLLRLEAPDGNVILLDFWFESLGIPGSLLCELFTSLTVIPPEELNDAQQEQAHRADVSQLSHPKWERRRKAERHLLRQEDF